VCITSGAMIRKWLYADQQMMNAVCRVDRKHAIAVALIEMLERTHERLRRADAALPTQSQSAYLGKSKSKMPESQPAARSVTSGWRSACTVSR
jgi:hypothetical protein